MCLPNQWLPPHLVAYADGIELANRLLQRKHQGTSTIFCAAYGRRTSVTSWSVAGYRTLVRGTLATCHLFTP